MRILLTISDFAGGGAEREFWNLVQQLSSSSHEIHLCLWRPVYAYPRPEQVPIHLLHKYRPWHVVRAISNLRRLIDELVPDLVFSQLEYVSVVTGICVERSRTRPAWIARIPGNPIESIRFPLRLVARSILRRADRLAASCPDATEALARHLEIPDRSRVVTLPNVVDLCRIQRLAREECPLPTASDRFTVVHAGRLTEQKNQSLLLAAFSRLRDLPAELWMLGEGPLRRPLVKLVRTLGIEHRVRWLRFQRNPYPYFRAADCFALSSVHEGMPNVLIESLACGTRVVSTACPYGPNDLIRQGINGFLTPMNDVTAYAGALRQLAQAPEFRRKLSPTDEGLEEHAPQRVVNQYLALFEQVVSERA